MQEILRNWDSSPNSAAQFTHDAIPFLDRVMHSPAMTDTRKHEAAMMKQTLETPAGPALLADPSIRNYSIAPFLQEVANPAVWRY